MRSIYVFGNICFLTWDLVLRYRNCKPEFTEGVFFNYATKQVKYWLVKKKVNNSPTRQFRYCNWFQCVKKDAPFEKKCLFLKQDNSHLFVHNVCLSNSKVAISYDNFVRLFFIDKTMLYGNQCPNGPVNCTTDGYYGENSFEDHCDDEDCR